MTDEALLEQLLAYIKRVIAEIADLDPAAIGNDTLLFPSLAAEMGIDTEALGLTVTEAVSLDSLDMLDAMVSFEETFGIHYDLDQVQTDDLTPQDVASPERIARYVLANIDRDLLEQGLTRAEATR